jgi:hypothetical protein
MVKIYVFTNKNLCELFCTFSTSPASFNLLIFVDSHQYKGGAVHFGLQNTQEEPPTWGNKTPYFSLLFP